MKYEIKNIYSEPEINGATRNWAFTLRAGMGMDDVLINDGIKYIAYIICNKINYEVVGDKLIIDDEFISGSSDEIKIDYKNKRCAIIVIMEDCYFWLDKDYNYEYFYNHGYENIKKYSIEEWVIKGILE